MMQNNTHKEEIKGLIRSMMPEITSIFGATLQQEVSTLVENLRGMTKIIKGNFSEILKTQKEDIINAITKKDEGISDV
jgi:hypothetical protein